MKWDSLVVHCPPKRLYDCDIDGYRWLFGSHCKEGEVSKKLLLQDAKAKINHFSWLHTTCFLSLGDYIRITASLWGFLETQYCQSSNRDPFSTTDLRTAMIFVAQPMVRTCAHTVGGRAEYAGVLSKHFKHVLPVCRSLDYTVSIFGNTTMEMCWCHMERGKKRDNL